MDRFEWSIVFSGVMYRVVKNGAAAVRHNSLKGAQAAMERSFNATVAKWRTHGREFVVHTRTPDMIVAEVEPSKALRSRNIKVADELWAAFDRKCKAMGTNSSARIRQLMEDDIQEE